MQVLSFEFRRGLSNFSKSKNLLKFDYSSSSITNRSNSLRLLGFPSCVGQSLDGPDLTPDLLLEHGMVDVVKDCDWRVAQTEILRFNDTSNGNSNGNSDGNGSKNNLLNAKESVRVGRENYLIHECVKKHAKSDDFLLMIGGDHSIALGTISGVTSARPNTGVIWVDAHADINTPRTSGSGNMHGMPVAFLLGEVEQEDMQHLPGMEWFPLSKSQPCLKPQDLVYIGLRDLDPGEKNAIKRLNIKAYTMTDIDRLGIGRVMEEVIQHFSGRDVHLSFDIDALDPVFAPHTGTRVEGGLTSREAHYICESIALATLSSEDDNDSNAGRLNLTSMELVEVNPLLHTDLNAKDPTRTIRLANALIGSILGNRIL